MKPAQENVIPKTGDFSSAWQRDELMGLNVAKYRAAHQILDNPKILEEPLALRIIGAEAESKLRLGLADFQKSAQRAFRAEVMVRNRYAEDELARSVQRGVRQYVILGAGLDTFAYRNPFPGLRVFEVDHPVTQAWKRSCLEKAAIPIPPSTRYVSVDFEQQTLTDALRQAGFKNDQLTFVCFIGVIRYLSGEMLRSIVTSIVASMCAGSEIVFDVGPPPSLLQLLRGRALAGRTEVIFGSSSAPSLSQKLRKLAHGIFSDRGGTNGFQPTYFDLDLLMRDLKRIGFADVQLFRPKEMNGLYCNARADGLRIASQMHLVKVRV